MFVVHCKAEQGDNKRKIKYLEEIFELHYRIFYFLLYDKYILKLKLVCFFLN